MPLPVGQWENPHDLPRQDSATPRAPEKLAANRPIARALRLARGDRSQDDFAAALRAVGVPAARNQVSGWELGSDPDLVSDVRSIAIVPGFVLVGASKISGRSVGELLTAAGVEGQDPYADRIAELERQLADYTQVRRRQQMIEEALNQLRADRGLPPLPIPEEGAVD